MNRAEWDSYLLNFQRRVIEDALLEATSTVWLRRADTFEAARPRPGDYLGLAGQRGAAEIDARCAAAARACRARAAVLDQGRTA